MKGKKGNENDMETKERESFFQTISTTRSGQHRLASHRLRDARVVLGSAVRDWRLQKAVLSETSTVWSTVHQNWDTVADVCDSAAATSSCADMIFAT